MSKRKGEDNSQDQKKGKRQRTDYKPEAQALLDRESESDEIDNKGDKGQEGKQQKKQEKLNSAPEQEPEADHQDAGGGEGDEKSGSESDSEWQEDDSRVVTLLYKEKPIKVKEVEADKGWG